MIRGVNHISLSTRSLERMTEFYQSVLGFTVAVEGHWSENAEMDRLVGLIGTSARVAILNCANIFVELIEYRSPLPIDDEHRRPPANLIGYAHVCFEVDDIDAEHRRLSQAGLAFESNPTKNGKVLSVYARDPDGNLLEFMEIQSKRIAFRLSALAGLRLTADSPPDNTAG